MLLYIGKSLVGWETGKETALRHCGELGKHSSPGEPSKCSEEAPGLTELRSDEEATHWGREMELGEVVGRSAG